MKITFIIMIIVMVAAGIIFSNFSSDALTMWGFYLTLFGFIISVGGTILSGLSFVNAKEAKYAAKEARNQLSKGMHNIDLSQLYKLGEEVREKAQMLRDKGCENHEEILKEIEQFAYKAEDMSLLISGSGFSTYPNLIRTRVEDYRKEIENPGTYDRQASNVSFIKDYISKILKVVTKQMHDNIK